MAKAMTFTEALNSLTNREIFAMEDSFGVQLAELSGNRLYAGVLYAVLRRTDETVTWDDVLDMNSEQMSIRFAKEPKDDPAGK